MAASISPSQLASPGYLQRSGYKQRGVGLLGEVAGVALCPLAVSLMGMENTSRTVICGRSGLGIGGRGRHDNDIGLFGRVIIVIDKHVVLRELFAKVSPMTTQARGTGEASRFPSREAPSQPEGDSFILEGVL